MDAQFVRHFTVLAAVAALLAGCSSAASGEAGSAGKPLELRLVISSTDGDCSAPAVNSDGPARACDSAGTTTFELGKSLGTITPTSVSLSPEQGSTHSVILELNTVDTKTLGDVSSKSLDQNLAIVLDGRVLSAPLVLAPITTSPLTLGFGTASEAKRTAAELSATP
jgi:preprotein translocase subunit SecD